MLLTAYMGYDKRVSLTFQVVLKINNKSFILTKKIAFKKNTGFCPGWVAQLVGVSSYTPKGLLPSQGTCLGCGSDPQLGPGQVQPTHASLSRPLPLSLTGDSTLWAYGPTYRFCTLVIHTCNLCVHVD